MRNLVCVENTKGLEEIDQDLIKNNKIERSCVKVNGESGISRESQTVAKLFPRGWNQSELGVP